jgi:hypothetical protein
VNEKTAFPLCWPAGFKRTPSHLRSRAKFQQTLERAQNKLHDELRRLGARDVIVSTNVPLRRDGGIYATWNNGRQPDDTGVAVYFTRKGKQQVMACDTWGKLHENLYAIALSVEAMRGLARWGVSDILERAFTGFAALPSSVVTPRDWREVLGCPDAITLEDANEAYKRARSKAHPDNGGSSEQFHAINAAWAQAEQELQP